MKNGFGKEKLSELYSVGWTTFCFDGHDESLLRFACSLGYPIPAKSNIPVIQILSPHQKTLMPRKTFSNVYGTGSFPLHTDTAHWPLPARFVILADVGFSHNRSTLLLNQNDFLANLDKDEAEHSVWKAPGPHGSFLCSLSFHAFENIGIRFDPLCMRPLNAAAQSVSAAISNAQIAPTQIAWRQNLVLIIDNWRFLHGRASCSNDDTETRILKRILVNKR